MIKYFERLYVKRNLFFMYSSPYSARRRSPISTKSFSLPSYTNKSPTTKDRYISVTPKRLSDESSDSSSPFSRSPASPSTKKIPKIKQISLDGPNMNVELPTQLVAWNEKGTLAIALGCKVYLYQPETEEIVDLFPDDSFSIIQAITWIKGRLVVSSAGNVEIWDTKAMKPIIELKRHEGRCCALSAIGYKLATGGLDGYIRIYDLSTDASTKMKISDEEIICAKWSQDGSYLAMSTADNCVVVIGASNYRVCMQHNHPVFALSWMQNTLFTGDAIGTIRKFSIPSGRESLSVNTKSGISGLYWSDEWGLISTNTKEFSSWEIYGSDLKLIAKFTAENGATLCNDFCEEKNYLAIAVSNEIIVVAKLYDATPKKAARSPSPFKTYKFVR